MHERLIGRLSKTIESQVDSIGQLTQLTDGLTKEHRKQVAMTYLQRNPVNAIHELQLQDSMKSNLVVLKAPEGADETTTEADDEKMTLHICAPASIPPDAIDEVFQQGIRKPSKSRPIKICSKTKVLRSTSSRRCTEASHSRKFYLAAVHSRGLTSLELQLEYSARRECYERNKKRKSEPILRE
ncbi:hypothetical protein Tcan_18615 [Toxocara canis]|uniref:Uncharacterized protein n=1 Tax=Toxocara canis TaxID=6265 RepID=A0A0B2V1F8_TOXCA|nr:hypothetical protein Tcan_18615 [Toxocara canis]